MARWRACFWPLEKATLSIAVDGAPADGLNKCSSTSHPIEEASPSIANDGAPADGVQVVHTASEKLAGAPLRSASTSGAASRTDMQRTPTEKCARTAAQSQVCMMKDIDAEVCDGHDQLNLGYLLEWMDAVSCLSAEKHCGRSAVTLVMDDVHFEVSNEILRRGQFCVLDGKVTRAFGSSMEVCVDVSCEDFFSETRQAVCHAYFMYVILKTEAEKASKAKVEAPELLPQSVEEHLEYGLANKRKTFRMQREARVRELMQGTCQNTVVEEVGKCVNTSQGVAFTELVLPFHANHMGNTFGGQIMCWMVKAAKKAIWLYLRRCSSTCGDTRLGADKLRGMWLHPVAIDQMRFKAPSHVGDRVQVFSRVTRVFSSSLEVVVRVTSAAVDAQDCPIEVNVGYLTYAVHDTDGPLVNVIPDITPHTVEQDDEHMQATARQQFRLQRMESAGRSKSLSSGVSVDFDPSQAEELSVHCISDILRVNSSTELRWETLPESGDGINALVDFGPGHIGSVTRMKISFSIACPPRDVYDLLRDVSRRKEWDKTCEEVGVRMAFTGANSQLMRMVFAQPATNSRPGCNAAVEKQEMLTIRTWRDDQGSNSFVVASRSVRCDSMKISPGMKQGDILPTGWIISEKAGSDGEVSHVVRIGQFSNESFEFVRPHALGLVKSLRDVIEKEAKQKTGTSVVEPLEEGDYI